MSTKMIFALLAAASLAGCAVYPLPVHRGYGRPVVVEQPAPVYVTPAPVYVSPDPSYHRGRHHGWDRDGEGRGRYER